MEKRVQITPRGEFLKVAPKWRRGFAEEAVEVVMAEGRYKEIMSRITGLTQSDLVAELAAVTAVKTRQKKQKVVLDEIQPGIEPGLDSDPDRCREKLQDPDSLLSLMLSIVKKYDKVIWDCLVDGLVVDYGYSGTDGSLDAALLMLNEDGYFGVEGEGAMKSVWVI